jgi:hypothetical protein
VIGPRLHVGTAWEGIHDKRGRAEVYLEPRDAWVGAYVAPDAVFLCPVPFLVIRVSRGRSDAT